MSAMVPGQPGLVQQPPKRYGRAGRTVALVALGFVGIVGLIIVGAVLLTRDMTEAGNRFLAEVTGPDPAPAWRDAGPELQRAIDEAAFRRWVVDHGLPGGTVSFWNGRSRTNDDGVLQGTMTLPDGSTAPLRLTLRRNAAGVWKAIGITVDRRNGPSPAKTHADAANRRGTISA